MFTGEDLEVILHELEDRGVLVVNWEDIFGCESAEEVTFIVNAERAERNKTERWQ